MKVLFGERLHINLCESVQKRLWQALSSSSLCQRVLGSKDSKGGRALKRFPQLRNEDTCTVIQATVEAFKNGLRRQIKFVEENPITLLDRTKQDSVTPLERRTLCSFSALMVRIWKITSH
jgi:hypothetical protein